ncbi:DUF881 domain-containing protein [Clostridium manihotivorum]|uniref:Division initiation protein n=1 Tax=Clostridium manihotivorum TaxID=2320868 RepID=A0A410DSE6_9CLOT|nr:DUF881 domain-containing protein [Clostridium manihotivorum]QAA32034.1 division initiation protein [Clostridium manihotivorum]
MKKMTSQIVVAIVCALLGFLLAYQFKLINNKESAIKDNVDKTDVVAELDALKKEKEELLKQNNSLTDDLKKIEESAAKKGDVNTEIKQQLDKTRMILGTVDVKGPGVILYLTPKSSFLTTNGADYISENELIHIVNILNFSGAEAISINDKRVTTQTGIKNASNYIWIGANERISPSDKIVIKAIGVKSTLEAGLTFQGALDYGVLFNYERKIEKSNEITIPKSSQVIHNDNIKAVQ